MSASSRDTTRLLGLTLNIGWQVVIPLVAFALVGRMADNTWHTSPLFFLIGVIISLVLSSWLIFRTVNRVISQTTDTSKKTQ